MRLKYIQLENIRSYLSQNINFPENGSLLLSGNIGSGKSTILLAIEFALFGIRKGELSGNALLRNGKDAGRVGLGFSVNGNDVHIARTLRKTSTGVSQDTGLIRINGNEQELSAIELKQKVLELLNYPKDLLTKSKSMIYRYTVYTPQEEMKHILLCDPEDRLDALRRVFGIDKYKRIIENSSVLVSEIKERKRECNALSANLQEKQAEKQKKELELADIVKNELEIVNSLNQLYLDIQKKKEELQEADISRQSILQLKATLQEIDRNSLMHTRQLSLLADENARLEQEISNLKSENPIASRSYAEDIAKTEAELTEIEREFREISKRLIELRTRKESAEHIISKMHTLSTCPTCQQAVNSEHKSGVIAREGLEVSQLCASISKFEETERELNIRLSVLKAELDEFRRKEKQSLVANEKLKRINDLMQRKALISVQEDALRKEVIDYNTRKSELVKSIDNFNIIDLTYQKKKSELEVLQTREREMLANKSVVESKKGMLFEVVKAADAEILQKMGHAKKAEDLSKLQQWLEDKFVSIMESMEKSIMLKVHADFSGLFEKWFSMLTDSESISAKLGMDFAPEITQNGYDIEYGFLSGGEKTAAALAYRLALNQVINNVISTIETKDLIILDEPTDGFSSEQLDKMRNLLEELSIGQVIIVSHEPKIESFVDEVIKFSKIEHISSIAAF